LPVGADYAQPCSNVKTISYIYMEEMKLGEVMPVAFDPTPLEARSCDTPLFSWFQPAARSDDLLVPDEYPTIQAAIDAASAGDQVLVAPGTYMEHIDYKGKAIVVTGVAGSESTVIDGTRTGRVVTFENGEKRTSVLQGFTITNGEVQTSNGGGIDCTLMSSPTITDCIISYNKADALGGGIACRGFSNPLIQRCRFIRNICRGYYEGSNGGGICCFLSSPDVIDCVFIGNETMYGGGIDVQGGTPLIVNCLFIGNVADKGGGAVDFSMGNATIINCTMVMNDAAFGGAMSITGAYLPSFPELTNCILWDNTPDEIEVLIGQPTITYSNVEGGWPGTGNIDANPLFVDLEFATEESDLHLTFDSPCINRGSNTVPGIPDLDFEGDPRIAEQAVDMGADEFYYHLYHKGDVLPGSTIDVNVIGYPTAPATLLLGTGLADPPYSTQYGDFYLLWPPQWQELIGRVPGSGVLSTPTTVPSGWISGSHYHLQALVGPSGGARTTLTNLMTLTVK